VTETALLWIILFAISACLFFGMAAIITVAGARDLKDLLRRFRRNG
jgi:hypothetical protein